MGLIETLALVVTATRMTLEMYLLGGAVLLALLALLGARLTNT